MELRTDEPLAYVLRASVFAMTTDDVSRAVSDLDHAISLEPQGWYLYGFRAYLEVAEKRFGPVCADLLRCALTFNQGDFKVRVKIDPETWDLGLSLVWLSNGKDTASTSRKVASDTERGEIAQGIYRLVEME